jgi:hypothetical protein
MRTLHPFLPSQSLGQARKLVSFLPAFVFLSFAQVWAETSPVSSEVELGDEVTTTARFTLKMGVEAGPVRLEFQAADLGVPAFRIKIVPDKEGTTLVVRSEFRSLENQKWEPAGQTELAFWPAPKDLKTLATLEENKIPVQTWRGKVLHGRVRREAGHLAVWLEGQLIHTRAWEKPGPIRFFLHPGADMESILEVQAPFDEGKNFLPVELIHLIERNQVTKAVPEKVVVEGVPFELWDRGHSQVSLAKAHWLDWKRDPSSYGQAYDAGAYYIGDPYTPIVQVPRADYCAAYVLAEADEDDATTNELTLRVGRRMKGASSKSQVLRKDFSATIPRTKKTIETDKRLCVIRIPFTEALAQDIVDGILDIEMTKEIRLARRSPDPNRFQWVPLGRTSSVHIAGLTLERSPIQMELRSSAGGNLFEQPAEPEFSVILKNITREPQKYSLTLKTGVSPESSLRGEIGPGQSVRESIRLSGVPLGYVKLSAILSGGKGDHLLTRRTSFGVLPPNQRHFVSEGSVGTGDMNSGHFTPCDPEVIGDLYRKLGLTYGMDFASAEIRKRAGVRIGREFSVTTKRWTNSLAAYAQRLEESPDLLPHLMIFHEDAISAQHATRTPDFFHDRPPYVLNPEEQKRFTLLQEVALSTAKRFREKHPEMRISLGNGPMVVREELYRHGFPADLFDSGGNENPAFSRLPETQPPDPIGNNSSLWMDRQLLDAYGYREKSVTQCHETIYPSTNPGNLSLETQAKYLIRHILHSMAWRIPQIRAGTLLDAGDSYYHSNWGGIGLFERAPEKAPKPVAISLATLTRVLDGAHYEEFLETGSDSAYLMSFSKKDGTTVFPFWVVRGTRDFTLLLDGASKARIVEANGLEKEVPVLQGTIRLDASPEPAYLILPKGGRVASVVLGLSKYEDQPVGRISKIDSLVSLEKWKVVPERSPELEMYNPLTPRRKGNFEFSIVSKIDGEGPALRVSPKPVKEGKSVMPMYAELAFQKRMELPGKPAEIGLWVNGNSSWSRVIFSLRDASGQRWVSIGAAAKGASEWMGDWLTPDLLKNYKPGKIADFNTDDPFGLSRINFDGWRYLGFPLPGQYPREGYHWPANSQWFSDGDGVVHYPLLIEKLIVEIPEKTLHLNRYAAVARPEIYLRNLVSVERDMDVPKKVPGDYVEAQQVSSR